MSFLFSFVIINLFLSMLCSFNWGFMFLFAWNFVMTFLVLFYILETKWVPISETISMFGGDIGFGKSSCQSIIILIGLKQNHFDNTNMLWTPFDLCPSCPWCPNWTWRNTNIKLCLEILKSNLPSYFMSN
jgi:ABC-type transport system involved in multi-copper enzyme maturation permease subunit